MYKAFIAFFVLTLSAVAAEQTGTLTQVQGEVTIFSQPSKTLPAAEAGVTRALYEGQYFVVKPAQVGNKIEKGNIVRTAPNGKARVVYDNGDQFNVGPGTAYKISWDSDTATSNTQVALMYGKFRGVVEKGGPRSKLQIRTQSAVMGVRGTDFFIAANGADKSTEVAIIRGQVEVKSDAPKAEAVQVKAGQSAEIAAPVAAAAKSAPVATKVELRPTTQEELKGIQKASKIDQAASTNAQAQALEKKAVDTTLKDIKATDPKLFNEISNEMKKNPNGDINAVADAVNTKSITQALKTAPKAPENRKPFKSEIEDLEAGAYNRYFKHVE